MTPLDFTRRTATLALLASLAACGGGGGGGDASGPVPEPAPAPAPAPAPTPAPAPAPAPATVTGQYVSQPPAAAGAASLTALNAQGARGFAFLGTLATNTGAASTEQGDFYVSDTAHAGSRLEYETVAQPGSGDALVAQLNAQGARGFAYKAPVLTGDGANPSALTVRDASRSTTFSYEKQPISGSLSRDAFQSQLNAQGARGYRLVGPLMAGTDSFNLYVKDSSATTYSYTVIDGDGPSGVGTSDALRNRLSTQGAQGQLFLGAFVIQGNASAQVFERSSAQNGAVEYDVRTATPQASIAQLTTAMNDRAAQGYFFFSDLVTATGEGVTLSVRNAANLRNPLAGITFP